MFLIFLSGEKTFDFCKIHLATVTEYWNTTSTNKKFSPSTDTFVFMSSKSDVTIAWNIFSQFQVHHHNPQGKHTQTGFKWVVQNLGYKFFPTSFILIVCNDENEYKKNNVYEIKLVRKTIHFQKKKAPLRGPVHQESWRWNLK